MSADLAAGPRRRGRGARMRALVLVAMLALAAAFVSACGDDGSSGDAKAGGGGGASKDKGALALTLPTLKVPLLQQVANDLKPLIEREGYELLTDDPDLKIANETRDWDAWIARGDVKVIMGFPLDIKGIVPVTRRAVAAGITVLGYSDNWEGTRAALVTDAVADGETLGRDAGDWIREHYGDKPVRVAVLATKQSPLEQQRGEGIQRGLLESAPNVQIDVLASTLRPAAYTAAKQQLVAHSDTKVWVSITVDAVLGARKALLDSGVKADDPGVYMGTIDATPEAIALLQKPADILRTAYYFPAQKIAETVAGLMLGAARGGPLEDAKLVPDRVTAENAAQYE